MRWTTHLVAAAFLSSLPSVLAQQFVSPEPAKETIAFQPEFSRREVVVQILPVNTGSFTMAAAGETGRFGEVPLKARQFNTVAKPKIGVTIPAADHGWTAGVGWWAKQAMALHPEIDWVYTTSATPEKQIADVEDMMVKGIDGLVILCTASAPLTPIAKKAHEKGIFIVNVDRGFLPEAGQIADLFLEGDNKAFGRKSAEFMVKKLNGKGNIVILSGIPCTVDTDRVNAAKEVFAASPEIKILAQQAADWNRQKGLQVMENMLNKHKKIDAVWAQDDDILLGALQAIKEAGREKEMWLFGGAGMKDVVKMVMDKSTQVPADMTYPPSMIAAGIHEAASAMRDGNKDKVLQFMPKHLMIDVELITPENAKNYYFPESVY